VCSAASWLLNSLNTHALPNANAQELEVWTQSAADWHEDVSFLPFCACKSLRSLKLEVRSLYLDLHSVQDHIYIYVYMVYTRYFWKGSHQVYGHTRCKYTALANLKYACGCCAYYSGRGTSYIITSTGKYLSMRMAVLTL